MGLRKVVLICLALILTIPLMVSCTKEKQDQMFDNQIDKLFGKQTTSVKVEYVDVNLTINLAVGKLPIQYSSPFEPAYPQGVILHIYRENRGKIFDEKDLEKWTDKQGKITYNIFFSRVYPDDIIYCSYKTDLFYWGVNNPGTDYTLSLIKSREISFTKDDIKAAKFDEKNNIIYLTRDEIRYLTTIPIQFPTKTVSPTPTKSR